MPVLLWDLDGTIVDSGPTIIGAIRETLRQWGLPDVPYERARACVGPPLIDSLPSVCGVPVSELDDFIAAYRSTYTQTMTTAPTYPGVPEVIAAAHDAGAIHALATAKPEPAAAQIIEAHGLTPYFTVVTGADPAAGVHHKDQVIERCLQRLHALDIDTSHALMIGDRSYDMHGARIHGLHGALVLWGYGSADEAAGFPVVATPGELSELICDASR